MRFWDTSALVPLLVDEPQSTAAREWVDVDGAVVISPITPIEIKAALWRRRHGGSLTPEAHGHADARFDRLSISWTVIDRWPDINATAEELLSRHQLRAGDAIQLAAAVVAVRTVATLLDFVTFDLRLAAAARAEGFTVRG